jgi:hypothetical protein
MQEYLIFIDISSFYYTLYFINYNINNVEIKRSTTLSQLRIQVFITVQIYEESIVILIELLTSYNTMIASVKDVVEYSAWATKRLSEVVYVYARKLPHNYIKRICFSSDMNIKLVATI